MKAILISIQPKWCELIASGKKIVEVRKTKPKLEMPFKCYIYETKNKHFENIGIHYADGRKDFIHNIGKVIGEFVCDAIFPMSVWYSNPNDRLSHREYPFTCLTDKDIMDYLGNGVEGYAWLISDLVIYDKPKVLSEFYVEGDCDCMNCRNCAWFDRGNGYNVEDDCNLAYKVSDEHKSYKPIKRPPQSWCYCEELKGATDERN